MSTKRKLPSKLAAPIAKQATRTPSKQILSEARAVVSSGAVDVDSPSVQLLLNGQGGGGGDVIEVSSDSSPESSEEDGDEDGDGDEEMDEGPAETNGDDDDDDDDDDDENNTAQPTEPSFGDLVLAHTQDPIPVSSSSSGPLRSTLHNTNTNTNTRARALPPGASLGVALAQALKTTDHALLESCLQTPDLPTIRSTIERLASPLAGTLLGLLAARLHRRPGRAGSLLVWIQWTLVVHGGYLATQAGVMGKLAELDRVVGERARGLGGLLVLKGKLDLLEAQVGVRRGMREGRRLEGEEEEEGVVYVEGEESEGDVVGGGGMKRKLKRSEEFDDSESEVSDEMPDTLDHRIIADSDASSDASSSNEDSDDGEGGLVDDEAEETDDDTGDDEEEVDFEDADEEEEDSDGEVATSTRPAKMARVNGMFGRSR